MTIQTCVYVYIKRTWLRTSTKRNDIKYVTQLVLAQLMSKTVNLSNVTGWSFTHDIFKRFTFSTTQLMISCSFILTCTTRRVTARRFNSTWHETPLHHRKSRDTVYLYGSRWLLTVSYEETSSKQFQLLSLSNQSFLLLLPLVFRRKTHGLVRNFW